MDWNNDGRLDIIVGNREGYVNYFRRLSYGDIFLEEELPVYVGDHPINHSHNSSPSVFDWNSDNLPDLIVGIQDGIPAGLYLYMNEGLSGDPVFLQTDTVMCSGEPIQFYNNYPDFRDMNGDGLEDLVLGSTSGKIACFENVGTPDSPLFEDYEYLKADGEEINFYSSVRPSICDWNEDGRPDMLIGTYTGNIFLFLGIEETGISSGSVIDETVNLLRIYGNPASGILNMEITLGTRIDVELALYDTNGRLLRRMSPGVLSSGRHLFEMSISELPGGIAFLVCTAGETQMTKPVVITP